MKACRLRWPLLVAITATALAAACSAVSRAAYAYQPAGPERPRPRASEVERPVPLPVDTASYWGVFEPGTPASYRPIQRFTALMGGAGPRIVLYFSDWGQPFDAAYALAAHRHGALTLVQIQPNDVSMAAIAAGRFDGYLRSYARQVRASGFPVIIGFAHEMNGPWYSWGFGHVRPRVWVAAWRHVVTVFDEQHADNVTWLWTVNITAPGVPSPRLWWPGSAYVTWVGIDGYYYLPDDGFQGVLSPTITDVRSFTTKPILIAETGITPGFVPGAMPGLIAGIRRRHLLGLVWFDADAGLDWRLDGHPPAVAAFRRGIATMLAHAGSRKQAITRPVGRPKESVG
jgi:mannan endo-1,4-beta-mannosidase